MTDPHDLTPPEPEPSTGPGAPKRSMPRFGAMRFEAMESMARRREAKRARTASQSWPEFFRSLGLEVAGIAAAVAVLALILWLWRAFS